MDFNDSDDIKVGDDRPGGKATKTTLKKVTKINDVGAGDAPFAKNLNKSLLRNAARKTQPSSVNKTNNATNVATKPATKPVAKETTATKQTKISSTPKVPPSYTKTAPRTTKDPPKPPPEKPGLKKTTKPDAKVATTTKPAATTSGFKMTSRSKITTSSVKDKSATNIHQPDLSPYIGNPRLSVSTKGGTSHNYSLGQSKKPVTKKSTSTTGTNIKSKTASKPAKKQEPVNDEPISRQSTFVKEVEEKTKRPQSSKTDTTSPSTKEYELDFEDESVSESPEKSKQSLLRGSSAKRKTEDPKGIVITPDSSISSQPPSNDSSLIEIKTNESGSVNKENVWDLPDDPEAINYDDDFEDYESDFEEYESSESGFTSSEDDNITTIETATDSDNELKIIQKPKYQKPIVVEEERKMDSGNYDLTMKMIKSDILKSSQLKEIKEAISRENTIYNERSLQPTPIESTQSESESPGFQLNIFNFKEAVTQKKSQKTRYSMQQRGQKLLSMIRLHPMNFSLIEISPTPYEVFIKLYGKQNTQQAFTQTKDDAMTESIQTDEIEIENKWTQHPIEYHNWKNNEEGLATYLEDRKGVGGDKVTGYTTWMTKFSYKTKNLTNFILNAGHLMLVLLEEDEAMENQKNSVPHAKIDYGFSNSFITITPDNINFLKGRAITYLLFSPYHSQVFLSCHKTSEENNTTFIDQYFGRCIICMWNVLEPSQPIKMFVASDQVTSICFDNSYDYLLYAGLADGSLCIWDMSERTESHQQNIIVDMPYILRSPTFCTVYSLEENEEEKHLCSVISVKSIGFGKRGELNIKGHSPPTRLVSLDQDGKLLIWTVIHYPKTEVKSSMQLEDICTAPWGRVKLICNTVLDPKKCFPRSNWIEFTCMELLPGTENPGILVGTKLGTVAQCLSSGLPARIPFFGTLNSSLSVTAIEICPHNFPVFLVGYDDGNVKMFNVKNSEPLLTFVCHKNPLGGAISYIKWSLLRPGLFFVMDSESNIHVWDIYKGDIFPQFTVPLRKKAATNMDLTKDAEYPYLGITIKNSVLQIHRFKDSFLKESKMELKDQKLFNTYFSKFV